MNLHNFAARPDLASSFSFTRFPSHLPKPVRLSSLPGCCARSRAVTHSGNDALLARSTTRAVCVPARRPISISLFLTVWKTYRCSRSRRPVGSRSNASNPLPPLRRGRTARSSKLHRCTSHLPMQRGSTRPAEHHSPPADRDYPRRRSIGAMALVRGDGLLKSACHAAPSPDRPEDSAPRSGVEIIVHST